MALGNGRLLKKLYQALCPFDPDGKLRPEPERLTLLASNVNPPLALEARAFILASAMGGGSPQIIQISYNCSKMQGSVNSSWKVPAEVKRASRKRPVAEGAGRSAEEIAGYVEDYGTDLIFVSLDHFTAPKLAADGKIEGDHPKGLDRAVAEALLKRAADVLEDAGRITDDQRDLYLAYMTSELYGEYRRDFFGAVKEAEPAWAMMDTGELPPVLNFATSLDLATGVRQTLDNWDCMIEAEISATGQSGGDEEGYRAASDEDIRKDIDYIKRFVHLTGAEAIAYDIGMQHAAAKGEKHEPDLRKLEEVQRALFLEFEMNIPFAQHGGTGAARVARGLVGKNNINTQYLVDAANAFADHYEEDKNGVRDGLKKACGTGIYVKMMRRQMESAVAKLRECGTYGKLKELQEALGRTPAEAHEVAFIDIEGKE